MIEFTAPQNMRVIIELSTSGWVWGWEMGCVVKLSKLDDFILVPHADIFTQLFVGGRFIVFLYLIFLWVSHVHLE